MVCVPVRDRLAGFFHLPGPKLDELLSLPHKITIRWVSSGVGAHDRAANHISQLQEIIGMRGLHSDFFYAACAVVVGHLGLQALFKLLPEGAIAVLINDDLGIMQQGLHVLANVATEAS